MAECTGGPHARRVDTLRPEAAGRRDTRALQHDLGHTNISHTVRYTDMWPDRFRTFWKD
jgi:type 1 fimbriae regulatory protein FimE